MSTFIKTPNIVTDGLVLYFDAGNKKSYNNRTNVLSQSETFSDTAVWSSLNVITLYNNTTDYLGNNTAMKIISTNTDGFHAFFQTINMSDNTVYTFMGELKSSEYTYALISATLNNSAYTESMLSIDLNNGTIANISNVIKSSSTDIGNGWWRVTLTFNSNEGVTQYYNRPPRVIVSPSPNGLYAT